MKNRKIYLLGFLIFVFIFIGCILGLKYKQVHAHSCVDNTPIMDLEYKTSIVEKSKNKDYKVENLRPLVGEKELTEFIVKNDNNPDIYNPKSKKFRANFHAHTTCSDGKMSVKEFMDKAQRHAKKLPDGEYLYIAITDHNTVLGIQEAVDILQKNPGKYSKIKIVPGIEIFTAYNNSKVSDKPVEIHVLCWCLNPYDEEVNKEYYKKDLKDKYNRPAPDRDFDGVITMMKDHGIVGIGHPARKTTFLAEKKYDYTQEMLSRYKALANPAKPLFAEGYYQSYSYSSVKSDLGDEYKKYLTFINDEASKLGIIRTGSIDNHGKSLFKCR